MPSSNTITNKNQSTIRFNTDPSILCSIKKTIRLFLRNELRYQTESRKDTLTITSSQIETETHHVILPSKSTTVKQTQIRKTPTKRVKIIPVHSNFWNSHQLHSPAAKQQSTQQQHKTRKKNQRKYNTLPGQKNDESVSIKGVRSGKRPHCGPSRLRNGEANWVRRRWNIWLNMDCSQEASWLPPNPRLWPPRRAVRRTPSTQMNSPFLSQTTTFSL